MAAHISRFDAACTFIGTDIDFIEQRFRWIFLYYLSDFSLRLSLLFNNLSAWNTPGYFDSHSETSQPPPSIQFQETVVCHSLCIIVFHGSAHFFRKSGSVESF